ncbi:ImmA/IrrE family metallo-endopeptidase [Microbispora sp. KK1-11]|uniref:ImmA/IrrE family metallo-endopeptidase n=1 Tax=Microbispora sp. KK1-11 TaxID=2053005 RepID=UPI00163CDF0A|nr:ImmA/IrrE family metallo-endopeptidase [Microbispora sp. KK1-11]
MTEKTWSDAPQKISQSFNPSRLTLARERRGLTKQGLAELCGVSRRTVSSWEAGSVENPPIDLLSAALDFPATFFLLDDTSIVKEESASFRAMSSMTARQVHRVLAASTLSVELSKWIDAHYTTPASDLPDFSETDNLSPAIAAESLRRIWGLPDGPIKNMLGLLERKGVRVFSLPFEDREVDAFSFWLEDRPFIFLNTSKTAERMRFDLAHELGHLLLHKTPETPKGKRIEQEAQDFASSLLVPADDLYEQVVGQLRLDDVFTLKKYWKISAVAMTQRLYQLAIISEWSHRTWMVELSQRGYRTSEPDGIHPETSRLFKQLFQLARQDGWSLRRIADSLHIRAADLDAMVFGLAVTSAPALRLPATSSNLAKNTAFG